MREAANIQNFRPTNQGMTKRNSEFSRNGGGPEVPYDILDHLLGEDENILLARVHPSGMILAANAMLAAAGGAGLLWSGKTCWTIWNGIICPCCPIS